jgi:hypothetical protein
MGRVYLAFTPAGRPVAIKVMRAEFGDDDEFRDRFRREVLAAKRVHGLYTAQVLDADPDAHQPWLATAYVPGLSLQQAVIDYGPLPPESVLLLVAGIAEALQAIHMASIVHRDLKPSNVILAADGPRVIDFGIARATAAPALTRSGIRVGSPSFMAPEQARGQPTMPTVDVFALGSVATYAASGHPPFGVGGTVAVLYRVINEAPDLDGCPPNLRPLIERCLAKDPTQRPQPGEIIETCRARTGDGALAFRRSWLPAAVSAIAAGGASVPRAPLSSGPGIGLPGVPGDPGSESTFPGEDSYPGAGAMGEGTLSGELRAPRERAVPDGSPPGMPQPAEPLARTPEPGDAGLVAGAEPAPPAGGGDAGLVAGAEPVPLAAGVPGLPGDASRGGVPSDGRPRIPRKAVVGAFTALLLLGAVAVGVAVLPSSDAGDGRRPAGPAPSPGAAGARARVHPTAGAHAAPVALPSSGPRSPSATKPQPDSLVPQKRATSPAVASPSPVPLSGRAAFGGTWSGTVSQPAWTVTSWTVELVIPAAGRDGSYSAPSLGCSGILVLPKTAGTAMTAVAKTTSPVNPGCVVKARLTLTLSGAGEMSMTWVPAGHPHKIGTALLVRS